MSVTVLTVLLSFLLTAAARWSYAPVDRYPNVPDYGPQVRNNLIYRLERGDTESPGAD